MPATDSVKEPTTPTEQVSANGTPKSRTPLPSSIMDSIRSAATKNLPASAVAPTTSTTTQTQDDTPKEPAKASAPPAVAKAADATPAAKPADKGAVTDAPTDKPAKKDGIAAVREALERAEARAKELKGSLTATAKEKADAFTKAADLEAKVRTYDERFTKEYEPQLKKLAEREKQVQEMDERLKRIDYTQSAEFHDRHIKPISEAQRDVEDLLKQVATQDGSPATMQHFAAVLSAPTLNEGERIAKQLFGDGFTTTEIVRQSARIRSLQRNLSEAQQKAAADALTWHKQQQEQQLTESARMATRVRERLASYMVKPADNDPEELAAMAEGQQLLEQLDKGHSDPEVRADIVAKAAAAGASRKVMELRLDRMSKENAALKEQLKRYQSNEPDVEGSGKGAPTAAEPEPQPGHRIGPSPVFTHALNKARQVAKGR